MKLTIAALFVLAMAAQAAPIDGHWTGETSIRGKKNPNVVKTEFALDLKTEGDALTGTVSVQRAKKPRIAPIQDVKIDGDTIHFTTAGAKPDTKFEWTLALNGDQLKVSMWREGAKRTQQFVATRAN
jgi:hypothetical protein